MNIPQDVLEKVEILESERINQKKKRILMLTLGTGNLDKATEDAGYTKTQYMFEGKPYQKDGKDKMTNFVSEPLIDCFVPDIIFILGTVKSVWHQFYASLTMAGEDDKSYLQDDKYLRLVDIERDNGIGTDEKSLEEYGNEISDILSETDFWGRTFEKYKNSTPIVRVLLTKYGINGEELQENYAILKGIEGFLTTDYSYDVAFDITHSFRSLPVYNLIIFNYIKNITKYDICIRHIYYGNLDVRRELNGVAPIVDLSELAQILDLTNGVSEFKNTGNAVSMLPLIEDARLKKDLEDFDLAIQLNAFAEIKKALVNLETDVSNRSENNRYTGIREMIEMVLREKFCVGENCSIVPSSDTDLKFNLTWWFFDQNRMGLGLATGLEALRDINTASFISAKGHTGEERTYRESAEKYFMDIAQRLSKRNESDLSPLEKKVCELGLNLKHYKDIRNMFAHSLYNSEDIFSLSKLKEDAERFREQLREIKDSYDLNQAAYCSLFATPISVGGNGGGGNDARIILDFDFNGNCRYNSFSSSNKKNYDVYTLDVSARTFFLKNHNNFPTMEKAYLLAEYIKNKRPQNYNRIVVILYKCMDIEKEMIFRIFLEQLEDDIPELEIESYLDGQKRTGVKKTGLKLNMEMLNNDEVKKMRNDNTTVMEKELEQK